MGLSLFSSITYEVIKKSTVTKYKAGWALAAKGIFEFPQRFPQASKSPDEGLEPSAKSAKIKN